MKKLVEFGRWIVALSARESSDVLRLSVDAGHGVFAPPSVDEVLGVWMTVP